MVHFLRRLVFPEARTTLDGYVFLCLCLDVVYVDLELVRMICFGMFDTL